MLIFIYMTLLQHSVYACHFLYTILHYSIIIQQGCPNVFLKRDRFDNVSDNKE